MSSSGLPKEARASLRRAWIKIAGQKPWLIREAIENGLSGPRPLGFLELGARLMKEIGMQEAAAPKVAIILNSSLDMKALQPGTVLALSPAPEVVDSEPVARLESREPDLTLLEETPGS